MLSWKFVLPGRNITLMPLVSKAISLNLFIESVPNWLVKKVVPSMKPTIDLREVRTWYRLRKKIRLTGDRVLGSIASNIRYLSRSEYRCRGIFASHHLSRDPVLETATRGTHASTTTRPSYRLPRRRYHVDWVGIGRYFLPHPSQSRD